MKKLKSLLAILLALVMVFAFCACDNSDKDEDEVEVEGEGEASVDEGPKYDPVTIGDLTIEYDGVTLYKPYETGSFYPLVYFKITNNSSEPIKPSKVIFSQAKVNDQSMTAGIGFQDDVAPDLLDSFYNEIAPGETVRCMECFSGVYEDGEQIHAVYEITVMDIYHEIEDKLVISFDTAELEIVNEA